MARRAVRPRRPLGVRVLCQRANEAMLGAAELLRGAGLNKEAAAGCSLVRMCVGRAAARGHDEHGGRSSCPRGMASTMHGTEQRERVARSYCSPGVSGKHNHYSPAVGVADARRCAAAAFSVSVKVSVSLLCFSRSKFQNELAAGDVILTADCNHAIEIMMAVLASPRANVLLPRPGYPTYEARGLVRPRVPALRSYAGEGDDVGAAPSPSLPAMPRTLAAAPLAAAVMVKARALGRFALWWWRGYVPGVNDWIYFHPHAKCFTGSPSRGEKKAF